MVESSFASNQTATSISGSKFILPFEPYERYGYCHIFEGHMADANGTKNRIVRTNKNQFVYAYSPEKTMKIAMEVINNTSSILRNEGNGRFHKEIYSPTDGQVVRVAYNRTDNFAGGKFIGHNYVIVSMFPIFD